MFLAYFHDMDWVFTFVNYPNIFSLKQIITIFEKKNFPENAKNPTLDNFEEETRKVLAKIMSFSALGGDIANQFDRPKEKGRRKLKRSTKGLQTILLIFQSTRQKFSFWQLG